MQELLLYRLQDYPELETHSNMLIPVELFEDWIDGVANKIPTASPKPARYIYLIFCAMKIASNILK